MKLLLILLFVTSCYGLQISEINIFPIERPVNHCEKINEIKIITNLTSDDMLYILDDKLNILQNYTNCGIYVYDIPYHYKSIFWGINNIETNVTFQIIPNVISQCYTNGLGFIILLSICSLCLIICCSIIVMSYVKYEHYKCENINPNYEIIP